MASKASLEMAKVLHTQSERVKMVDMHPTEPLVLCSLYSGQVTLWNYDNQTMLRAFDVCDQAVRCVRFITRLQSFACGSDDMCVRVFNYDTMEKTKTFEAHQDFIRGIAVHDQLPYLLTCSDDMTIKMWDWSSNWRCAMTFEGHSHYVMNVVFNPKDPTTFASASLDSLVKVWSINSPTPNFSLEGHEKGVNTVEYFNGGDKPYLVTGSDDNTVRVWDYQTKACLRTLSLHDHNITSVIFHPDLPLVFSGSEDETVAVVSSQTWRQETTLNHGLGRVWTLSSKPRIGRVAIGCDRGMVVLKVGKEEPVMSMDTNGKILFAATNEIIRMDIKNAVDKEIPDGELIQLPSKEVGTAESMPTKIIHGPNGQYVAVLTDGEFTVNSALQWRPKCAGPATAFVWGNEGGSFAVLENPYTLKTFKQFKLKETLKLPAAADALFGGPVIGVRTDSAVTFYDWEQLRVVREISETPKEVCWSDSHELVALVSEASAFFLKYRGEEVMEQLDSGAMSPPDGFECAFDLVQEIDECVRRSFWVGDCFVYVNKADRLCYYIGGETTTLAVLQRHYFLLGYVARENRLYCMDRDRNVIAYQMFTSVIEYKTAIVREDFETAAAVLPRVPESMKHKVAEFLQARNHLALALDVTPDQDHRFDLAVQLSRLDTALEITRAAPSAEKWKQVGDLALEQAFFDIAEAALKEARDLNGLLLLYSSTGDYAAIAQLGGTALQLGAASVAFTCFQMTQQHDRCIDVLCATHRFAEAAFYARTYQPARICGVADKWRAQLAGTPALRDSIADPVTFPNLFPNLELPVEAAEPTLDTMAAVVQEEELPMPQADPVPASPKDEDEDAPTPAPSPAPGALEPEQEEAPTPRPSPTADASETSPVGRHFVPEPETPFSPAEPPASPVTYGVGTESPRYVDPAPVPEPEVPAPVAPAPAPVPAAPAAPAAAPTDDDLWGDIAPESTGVASAPAVEDDELWGE